MMPILPLQQLNDAHLKSKNEATGQVTYRLMILLVAHSLEFVALGLWLSSWGIYSTHALRWSEWQLGWSFSVTAFAGIAIVPFMRSLSIEACPASVKMLIGLLLLLCQPLSVLYLPQMWMIWCSFILGGAGGTLYFASFNVCVSANLSKKSTAVFYGLVGSATFFAMAVGQGIAPYLWQINLRLPIYLDSLMLLLSFMLSMLVFVFSAKEMKK